MSTTYTLLYPQFQEGPSTCPKCSKVIKAGEPIHWPGGMDTHIECPVTLPSLQDINDRLELR